MSTENTPFYNQTEYIYQVKMNLYSIFKSNRVVPMCCTTKCPAYKKKSFKENMQRTKYKHIK